MKTKIRVGALISGGGTNLQAIIDSCEQGRIDAEMVCVGSDKPEAFGLDRARKHGIPSFVVDYGRIIRDYRRDPAALVLPQDFDFERIKEKQALMKTDMDRERLERFLVTRAVAEAHLLEHLDAYQLDLLVLAGFMRNLTPYFIDRFNSDPALPRIMNIHPALLPAFPGTDGYGDTFRYGCKVGGCTVHFIDYGEDSGPIIGQRCFAISDEDALDVIKKRGLELEWELYPECIQLYARKRLMTATMTYTLDNGEVVQRTIVKIAKPA